MTHKTLVLLAEKHLRAKCGIVFTEYSTAAGEIPDAIGWRFGVSTLVECKASRSDFLRDKNKCCRRRGLSMGRYRYYLCPTGVIHPADLPAGWGLLWAQGARVSIQVKAEASPVAACDVQGELCYLSSMLRRAQVRLGHRDLNEWLRRENMAERVHGILPSQGGPTLQPEAE